MIPARVTFLGSGTSSGTPVIGCSCAVCRSTDPRDARLRPSILIEASNHACILVDTTPDLRQQALRHGMTRLDAVIYTHSHADHIFGLDELRRFNFMQGGPIPCYANAETWDRLRRTFFYVFDRDTPVGGGIPKLDPHEIAGPFTAAGVSVVPVPIFHGRIPILGFRFGTFAYLTDCSSIPDESWPLLAGVETLVIDALREKPHPTHFTIDEALAAVGRIAPARAYFTHMTHDLGYAETCARLPTGVELAYDGLAFDIAVEAA